MGIHVCTIIARNYLASARVLSESFSRSNENGTLTVLVIDDNLRDLEDGVEPFEILHLDEIGIDKPEILTMAAIYNVTEFATAVKPWLIQTLIDRWNEPVIYLDPDIMVFRSLEDIQELALEHELVITPHASQPIPRDDKNVSESEILATGIYNLGFIAVGTTGTRFLEFWKERLKRECISDPKNMRFVDQRWVDFAPAMFDAFILKAPTYNVAYWNLHYLDFGFDKATNRYTVNDLPIHFFHFSGYDPKVPELLSKYQGGHARILFSDRPELKHLCDVYRDQLFTHGYKETISSKYAFSTLSNGMQFDIYMRGAFQDALLESEKDGTLGPPNPFVSADLFLLWLNSRDDNATMSRYLKQIYQSRDDLKTHFPDADGPGIYSLLAWCLDEASKGNYDSRLIPNDNYDFEEELGVLPSALAPGSSAKGIQVSGYFRAEMGVGEFARNTVAAVAETGIPYSTFTDTDVIHRQDHKFKDRKGGAHAVNLICMNADSLEHFAYRMGDDYFKDRYTIGIWAWELEEFPPEFDSSFAFVDEIWANSEFTRNTIAKRNLKPVYAMPVTVDPPIVTKDFDLSKLGIPKAYTFLFCFDLLSVFERKNPIALIDAFTSAFSTGEGPVLVIKALNGDKKIAELEELKIRSRDRSDIFIIDEYLDHEDNIGLFNASDCYVSLHRSEGLGLTIAEAMALGKPVIATAYSGNLDFMNEDNSFLIPFTYGEVEEGNDPYPPGARWAEPDVSEAARVMRWVYENPEIAAAVGGRAQRYMADKHTPGVTSAFISKRYANAIAILGSRDTEPRFEVRRGDEAPEMAETAASMRDRKSESENTSINPDGPPPLIALASRSASYDAPSRFPRLVRIARRIISRLLVSKDNQQQEFNIALAMGTEHLARLRNEMQSQLDHLVDMRWREQQSVQTLQSKINQLTKVLVEQNAQRELSSQTSLDLSSQIETLEILASDHQLHFNALEDYLHGQLQSMPYMSDPDTFIIRNESNEKTLGYQGTSAEPGGYAGFEDLFRGSEENIRERQRVYLEFVNSSAKIIDVGSGRGEFLDVLNTAHLPGSGVDIDESMVARASQKGLSVVNSDAIEFLRSQESETVSTIFSAQLVEHLNLPQLRLLIDESYRVLIGEGVLILETVNPYSMPAFRTFWTDLSHEKPIFPEVLLSLIRETGFKKAHVIFPNGTGDLDTDRWTQGEYAIIAHR